MDSVHHGDGSGEGSSRGIEGRGTHLLSRAEVRDHVLVLILKGSAGSDAVLAGESWVVLRVEPLDAGLSGGIADSWVGFASSSVEIGFLGGGDGDEGSEGERFHLKIYLILIIIPNQRF